jgi:type IV secretion system protein VirB5
MQSQAIRALLASTLLAAVTTTAHAQFAVIDVAALSQLVSEVSTLEQQLATARGQLTEAQAQYQAMTGNRGMQQLLAGSQRNYLPPDWTTLTGVATGNGGAYPLLAANMRSAMGSTAVLSATQLAALPATASGQLQAGRVSVALLEGVTHTALANSSARFAALQQLIDAIGRAQDQKAALDLQARISAELGMLQDEHTKLDTLYQGAQADQQLAAQRTRELIVAGHGQFAGRFEPRP